MHKLPHTPIETWARPDFLNHWMKRSPLAVLVTSHWGRWWVKSVMKEVINRATQHSIISNIHVWCLAKAPGYKSLVWPCSVSVSSLPGRLLPGVARSSPLHCQGSLPGSMRAIILRHHGNSFWQPWPPWASSPETISSSGAQGGTAEPSRTQYGHQALLSLWAYCAFSVERFKEQRKTDEPSNNLQNMSAWLVGKAAQ